VDGNPDNNFLDQKPEATIRFNPDGKLTGAMHSFMAGTNLFVVGKNGLFVLGLSNKELVAPTLIGELPSEVGRAVLSPPRRGEDTAPYLRNPRHIAVQFRYAFVCDDDGLKVIDIGTPSQPKLVPGATVPLKQAGRLYVARTFAYIPNGAEGLAIIDIGNPEKPKLDQMFNAGGVLN